MSTGFELMARQSAVLKGDSPGICGLGQRQTQWVFLPSVGGRLCSWGGSESKRWGSIERTGLLLQDPRSESKPAYAAGALRWRATLAGTQDRTAQGEHMGSLVGCREEGS